MIHEDEQTNIVEEHMTAEVLELLKATNEYKKAVESGKDVNALISEAQQSPRYQKYKSPNTRLSILRAALAPKAEPEGDPFDEVLFVFAGGDGFGTKRPINFIAMRKDRSFVEVVSWDSEQFQVPCKCRVTGGIVTNQYGTKVNIASISDVEPKTLEDCQKALQKSALSIKHISELTDLGKFEIHAFRGSIRYVSAEAVFADGKKVGEHPVWCDTENNPPKKHFVGAFSLEGGESGFGINLHVERQRVGKPIIAIDDLFPLAEDAVSEKPDSPKDQASFVQEGVFGREVLALGRVSSVKESKDGDKLYIHVATPFIMQVLSGVPDNSPREKLVQDHEVEPEVTANKKTDKYIHAFVTFGLANNEDPQWIPFEKARRIAEIPDEIPDAIIHEIKMKASALYKEQKSE